MQVGSLLEVVKPIHGVPFCCSYGVFIVCYVLSFFRNLLCAVFTLHSSICLQFALCLCHYPFQIQFEILLVDKIVVATMVIRWFSTRFSFFLLLFKKCFKSWAIYRLSCIIILDIPFSAIVSKLLFNSCPTKCILLVIQCSIFDWIFVLFVVFASFVQFIWQ